MKDELFQEDDDLFGMYSHLSLKALIKYRKSSSLWEPHVDQELVNRTNYAVKQFTVTPLHFLAYHGHLEIYQSIIEKLDDKNPRMIGGKTPLHFAAKYGHVSMCRLISSYLSDKNPKDDEGLTPLHLASKYGALDVMAFLMEVIDDQDPIDNKGRQPVEYAFEAIACKIDPDLVLNSLDVVL